MMHKEHVLFTDTLLHFQWVRRLHSLNSLEIPENYVTAFEPSDCVSSEGVFVGVF